MVFVPNGWSSKIITYFITCVNIHQKKDGISSKVNYHPRYKAYFQHPFHKWLISLKNGWYASELDDH
jgi:hypothetical protein